MRGTDETSGALFCYDDIEARTPARQIYPVVNEALAGLDAEFETLYNLLGPAINVADDLPLPSGCSVTYDLRVVEILRDLLRPKSGIEDLEAQYRDFRLRHGQRPTAAEIARMGFDPARTGHPKFDSSRAVLGRWSEPGAVFSMR